MIAWFLDLMNTTVSCLITGTKKLLAGLLSIIRSKIMKTLYVKVIEALVFGVIVAIIASLLLSIPRMSITNTVVNVHEDTADFEISYENKGRSPAIDLYLRCVCIDVGDSQGSKKCRSRHTTKVDRVEIGDNIQWTEKNIPFKGNKAICVVKTEFSDTSRIRQCVNSLFSDPYESYKWCALESGNKAFTAVRKEDKEKWHILLKAFELTWVDPPAIPNLPESEN